MLSHSVSSGCVTNPRGIRKRLVQGRCASWTSADTWQHHIARVLLIFNVALVNSASLLEVTRVQTKHDVRTCQASLTVGVSLIACLQTPSIVFAAIYQAPEVRVPRRKIEGCRCGVHRLTCKRSPSMLWPGICHRAPRR